MDIYRYKIYYMRGDIFEYTASSEKEAFKILFAAHPEYRSFDILKVEKKKID